MMQDTFLYIIFPYTALILAIIISIMRYTRRGFSYSSLSSQFLENKKLFYGSVPWHYGIIAVLTGHLIGFLIPDGIIAFNSVPLRLYFMELSGFALALFALTGLANLIVRRFSDARIWKITTVMDIVVLALLLLQVGLGVYIAVYHRWGANWYAISAVPYLWSLVSLRPDISQVSAWPLAVKLHVIGAYSLLAIMPFTRLVHVLVMPLHYLWRPHQKVVWNQKKPSKAR